MYSIRHTTGTLPNRHPFCHSVSSDSHDKTTLTAKTGTGTQPLTPAFYVPHGDKPSEWTATLAYERRIDEHTRDTLSADWLETSAICHCEGHL